MESRDKFMDYIDKKKYKKYDKGKYRKKLLDSQYSFPLFTRKVHSCGVCLCQNN